MATEAEIEAALDKTLGSLETTLALQWALSTGALRAGADVNAESKKGIILQFRKSVSSSLKAAAPTIRRIICDDLEYCKHKETKKVRAALLLADAKLAVVTGVVLPMASMAAYLIKASFLDRVCGCDQKLGATIPAMKLRVAKLKKVKKKL